MTELTLTLLRLGYLGLLWVLVLAVALVVRRDVYGTRVTRKATPTPRPAAPAAPAPAPSPAPAGPATPAQAPAASTALRLVVTEGSLQGTTLTLGQAPVLVGRAPECTLVLDDDYASGRHARFFLRDGLWHVEDLGSTNGTFIGRDRLTGPATLRPGIAVKVGRTVIELRK